MLFSKKQSIVGIDIGTSYIKVAQIRHSEEKTLETYGIVNASVQLDAKSGDATINQIAQILTRLLSEANVSAKRAVVSLPNSAVFTVVIDMPLMTDTELSTAIPFEAKKYIPLPFSEVVLSWSIVYKNETARTLKVLLIAVPKQIQESYIKLFSQVGLELEIIEIEALSLIRSLVTDPKENSVIIDIGAKSTGLNVVSNGILQMTRNLNIGGDTITDKLAQSLSISPARAEQFKREFGLSKETFIPEAIKPIMQTIKNEVKQLLSVYTSHNLTINKLVLVGGGANLQALTEFFSDIGLPVELGNPLSRLKYPEGIQPVIDRYQLQLPIAIGLALRNEK